MLPNALILQAYKYTAPEGTNGKSVRTILSEALARYGVTLSNLRSATKITLYVVARRECYEILRARGWSYSRIGKMFNKHHATVMWALKATSASRRHVRWSDRVTSDFSRG